MSRFLFVMMEGGGNVPPQLGLASRLRARGHDVRVLGDPAIEADARALGLDLVPFQHAPHHNLRDRARDRLRDYESRGAMAGLKRATREVTFGPAAGYAADTLAQIEAFAPDALAVDCVLAGAVIAAESAKLPFAVLVHTFYLFPVRGAPPYGFGMRPARGLFGRLGHAALRRLSGAWFDREGLATVNELRTGLGLERVARVLDQLPRADRVLVMTAESFDFASRGALPANVRYVGPGLEDPVWAHGTPQGTLGAVDVSAYEPVGDAPLVVVGLGSTFQRQKALTQRMIDALASLPVRGLVTLGEVFEPSEFSVPSASVRVVRAAPHAAVFPRAAVVVAHGGHGTVMKALSCGVPVLCSALGRDQADNAVRVEVAGAGLQLPSDASVGRIRQALLRLLHEPRFREAAGRLAGEIHAYGRADAAVRELERLAAADESFNADRDVAKAM